MIEFELQIPDSVDPEAVRRIVEQVCASNELTCSLRGALVSYPGSIHWHFKRDQQRGTLEITWRESGHRFWCKVAHGRMGEWIFKGVPRLKEPIESCFYNMC
jgi:hypothetical protein